MASVEGSLSKIGVPELFRSIARERRTGSLTLTRSGAEARVFFRDGGAYHARSIGSGIQLGARLISAGVITQDDLNDALARQRAESGARRLGQILLDTGLVTPGDLQTIVTQQIEDTIFEILRWDGGEFRFDQDVRTDEDIGLHVSVENLVMEGARRFREWHQITRRVPTLEAVPVFNENSAEIDVALTPEEWAFVSRVDGRSTIKELAIGCGFTDLEAGRTVFGLITAGLLDIDLPEGIELPVEDAELDDVFDELERALQEAAAPKPDATGPQPTLEELIIGKQNNEVEDSYLEAEQSSFAEEIPQFVAAEELPVLEEEIPQLAPEEPAVLEEEIPQLAPEEPAVLDETVDVAPGEVPIGQDWGISQPDEAPEPQAVPVGHGWEDSIIDSLETEPELATGSTGEGMLLGDVMEPQAASAVSPAPLEEPAVFQDATPLEEPAVFQEATSLEEPAVFQEATSLEEPAVFQDATALEEPAVFQDATALEATPLEEPAVFQDATPLEEPVAPVAAEAAIVEEGESLTSNGSHPLASSGSNSWGDLRVEMVEEEDVKASVITEESVPPRESPVPSANPSLARLFAELSSPPQQTTEVPSPSPATGAAVAEEQPTPRDQVAEQGPTPRPVDPSVDTTALLREFSGLGLTDEQASPDWGQMEAPRRVAVSTDPDKGRGLFGKKRR